MRIICCQEAKHVENFHSSRNFDRLIKKIPFQLTRIFQPMEISWSLYFRLTVLAVSNHGQSYICSLYASWNELDAKNNVEHLFNLKSILSLWKALLCGEVFHYWGYFIIVSMIETMIHINSNNTDAIMWTLSPVTRESVLKENWL